MSRRFLLLGSGEFEPWSHDAEAAALRDATGDGSVVILPTASSTEGDAVFDRWGRMGLDHYAEVGIPAEVLPVKTTADAAREDLAARAEAASMIYLSGGKPTHLAEVLHGSALLAAIGRAMDRGAVWAGCSAGAMVVGVARSGGEAGTRWRYGLGLVPNVGFGVHWDKVRRVPGAAWWMSSRLPDGSWFVGIDERTAIYGDAVSWTVMGLGSVTVRHGDDRSTVGAGGGFATATFKGS
jgi:cyanophycinase